MFEKFLLVLGYATLCAVAITGFAACSTLTVACGVVILRLLGFIEQ